MERKEYKLSKIPVEIAGAGPAGLAAEITLAYTGRQVVVYETHKEVRHRFGDDFQGLENWTSQKDVLQRELKPQMETTTVFGVEKRIMPMINQLRLKY